MAQSTKEIVRRIKSVGNTKKITKAMELVSAAKMKKSVEATLASRFYAHYAWEILKNLSASADLQKNDLFKIRPVKKIGVILISSDKGLCGSYNSAVVRKLVEALNHPDILAFNGEKNKNAALEINDLSSEFICIGKKGGEVLRKLNKKIVEFFPGFKDKPRLREVKPIAELIIKEYKKGSYDKVFVAFTDYVSAVRQEPKIRQILPVSQVDLEELIKDLDIDDNKFQVQVTNGSDYLYEPNKKELVNNIIPKLIEMQLYQMVMEAVASENSARMLAMKNASEAADEMINELTLIYNKARQSAITQEIAEISAGKAALENS